MRRPHAVWGLALGGFLGIGTGLGCQPCDRDGCDAQASAVPDVDRRSGVAGAIAGLSDVVANGCQECGFTRATLAFWSTDTLVTDAATAKALVNGTSPAATLEANARYRQDLAVGHYLVCRRPGCVAVEVVAGHVSTVHVKVLFGPPHFIAFDPSTKALLKTEDLDVGL